MWAIELGPPSGGAARRIWDSIERRQAGLAAQLLVVPLFRDHRILTQVAGHSMNVVKALPPLVIADEDIERFADALDQVIGGFESLGQIDGPADAGNGLARPARQTGTRRRRPARRDRLISAARGKAVLEPGQDLWLGGLDDPAMVDSRIDLGAHVVPGLLELVVELVGEDREHGRVGDSLREEDRRPCTTSGFSPRRTL